MANGSTRRQAWRRYYILPNLLNLAFLAMLGGMLARFKWLDVAAVARSLGDALPFHQFYLCLAVAMLVSRLIPISVFEIGSGAAALAHQLTRLGVSEGLVAGHVLLAALFSGVVFPLSGCCITVLKPGPGKRASGFAAGGAGRVLARYSEPREDLLLVDFLLGAGDGFLYEELEGEVEGIVLDEDVLAVGGEIAWQGNSASELDGAAL